MDTEPSFDPDKTNPNIVLPESSSRPEEAPEHPLEELLSADAKVRELERRIQLLNRSIQHKIFEYGGLKVMKPRFNLNLELSGVDENGMEFTVPRDQVKLFLESARDDAAAT